MLMPDSHELIITKVISARNWCDKTIVFVFPRIGAAKTLQRKAGSGEDFGATYKIVPMSGKFE